jgi:hypothetical protein
MVKNKLYYRVLANDNTMFENKIISTHKFLLIAYIKAFLIYFFWEKIHIDSFKIIDNHYYLQSAKWIKKGQNEK